MDQVPVTGLPNAQRMVRRPLQVYLKSTLPVVSRGYMTKPLINQFGHSLIERIESAVVTMETIWIMVTHFKWVDLTLKL